MAQDTSINESALKQHSVTMVLSTKNSLAESDLMVGVAAPLVATKLSWSSESVNHVLHVEQDYDDVSKPADVVGHRELEEKKTKQNEDSLLLNSLCPVFHVSVN